MINENRIGLLQNPGRVVAPAVLIALLTIGVNTFTDAVARVAIGVDRGAEVTGDPEAAVSGRAAMSASGAPVVTKAFARGRGPEDLRRGDQVDVVDEVTFSRRGRRGPRARRRVGSGKTTVALAMLAHTRRGLEIAGGPGPLDGVDLLVGLEGRVRRIAGTHMSRTSPRIRLRR